MMVCALYAISFGEPVKTIRPPAVPPSGPTSMIQSACFIHLPLALRGDGIEHDAGFPGAGDPGEHHDFSLGNVQGIIFQVVLAKAPNDDLVFCWQHISPS